jgi:hypothetical protein
MGEPGTFLSRSRRKGWKKINCIIFAVRNYKLESVAGYSIVYFAIFYRQLVCMLYRD